MELLEKLVKSLEKYRANEIEQMVLNAYPNLSLNDLRALVEVTNRFEGVSFVSIKDYQSDESNGTEIADHLINVNASYENMLVKDAEIYSKFDVRTVDVDKFNYMSVDCGKLTLDEYKQAVKEYLPIALAEMQAPKTTTRDMSAFHYFNPKNRMLSFNSNTGNLLIFGMDVNKTVKTEGEFKVVNSEPKTIAKKLIEKKSGSRTATLRSFKIQNMATMRLNGDTLIFE